jgi:tight adherence protein C
MSFELVAMNRDLLITLGWVFLSAVFAAAALVALLANARPRPAPGSTDVAEPRDPALLVWFAPAIRLGCPRPVLERQRTALAQAGLSQRFDAAQWLAVRAWILIGLLTVAIAGFGILNGGAGRAALIFTSAVLLAWLAPRLWLHDRCRKRRAALLGQLPFYVDLLVICLESGLNLAASIEQAIKLGPAGAFSLELTRVPHDLRSGQTLAQSLRGLAQRTALPQLQGLVSALVAAQSSGSDLALTLKAQARQLRDQQFFEAEHDAMRAPVKMLAPLLLCVFPCTFLMLLFPVVVRLSSEGVLR